MKTKFNTDMKRCAIYIRVSTAMQRMEGWSLDAQRASLTAFAQSRGWKVIGIYADEGKSARKRLKDRKAIFKLLEDVQAGAVDVILFKELDRWFRNVSDFYKVQDILDAAGVTWISERQPTLDMTTKEGRLNVNVLLSVGQNEADSTSDRIKYTNKYLRQQKRWTCGPGNLPKGHKLDENKHVIIDPEREPYVRFLIGTFMRTGSVRRTVLQAETEFGVPIHYGNTVKLLQNPMLCGEYMGVEGFVEKPYMTVDQFQDMQRMLKKNARQSPCAFYVFATLVKCGCCGRNMAGIGTVTNSKTYRYYRCNGAVYSSRCTHTRRINERNLERDLLPFVRQAIADRIGEVRAVRQNARRKPRKGNRESIERQLDKLDDLYISNDRMTKEKYEEKRQAILAKLVEDEPEEALPEIADLEKIQAIFNGEVEELYSTFTPEERREFWRGILNSVTVLDGQIVDVEFIQ